MLNCNQAECHAVASYRFTWPGRDEAGICAEHAGRMKGIADALGLYVQLIPVWGTPALVQHTEAGDE